MMIWNRRRRMPMFKRRNNSRRSYGWGHWRNWTLVMIYLERTMETWLHRLLIVQDLSWIPRNVHLSIIQLNEPRNAIPTMPSGVKYEGNFQPTITKMKFAM
jgi:hypothetical protein